MTILTAATELNTLTVANFTEQPLIGDMNAVRALTLILACAFIAFMCPNSHEILSMATNEPDNGESRRVKNTRAFRLGLSVVTPFLLVWSIASMNQISEFLYFQF